MRGELCAFAASKIAPCLVRVFIRIKNLIDSLPLRYAETLCLFKYIMLHTLLLSGLETGNRRLFKDGGSIIVATIGVNKDDIA